MSLLYRSAPPPVGISEKTLYHLSADRILQYLTPDVNRRAEFADILSRPLTDAEDILYRQSILRDLDKNRPVFEELLSLFERFADLHADHKALSCDDRRIGKSGNDTVDSAKNLLQSRALCLRRALLFLKSIRDTLSTSDITSDGLNDLKDELSAHICEPSFSEMTELCRNLEAFKASGALALSVSFDKDGKASRLSLIEPGRVKITDPELKKSAWSRLFSKEQEEVYPCERVIRGANDGSETLLISAIRDLSELLSNAVDSIFEKYLHILRELRFYELALKYIELLCELELPICTPTFGNSTDIRGLYDLFLSFTRGNSREIVPNDVKIPENSAGILLYGANGTGKTVFLRSMATAQIFAQSGLPIAASSAVITPRTGLLTQFSEAEKEFEAGNDAGRFEQEVREIAAMLDKARRGSFVFLNETFQTTAYAEGAAGLAEILKYFARNSVFFIAVTHLHELENHFSADEAVRMRTAEGFKVETANRG